MLKRILVVMAITLVMGVMGSDACVLAAETVSEKNTSEIENNYWLEIDGDAVVGYGGTPVDVVIPSGITKIAGRAFYQC